MTPAEIEAFVADGFVRLDGAFPPEVAAACRARLVRDLGCDLEERATWTEPVVRLGMYTPRSPTAARGPAQPPAVAARAAPPRRPIPGGARDSRGAVSAVAST